ncbi:hypothetical protein [Maridesulfovibrio sp.]|uniref:glycosyltransferase family 4 protein n=1 Tax=Maridesulfovibrio sp. TaxID=2795000 RepID=UPI0029CA1817|nr:hypothetical protein [Maridesulfovibrio sp.]
MTEKITAFNNKVLMVHESPCIRVVKEVDALRQKGISIDLLCSNINSHPEIAEKVGTVFYYNNYLELRSFLKDRHKDWDVIHAHNEPNCIIASTIEACNERPVVYDCHDMTSARSNIHGVQAELEEYCFKNCAASVHVSAGLKKIAFDKYGPQLSIVLPSFPAITKTKKNNKPKLSGTHVVYQGTITDSPDTKYSYRYYLPFFKKLCEAGIHVHVFHSPNTTWEKLPGYIALQNRTRFFHPHKCLPYDQLIHEMGQFQWGFSGFNFDHLTEKITKDYLDGALPNKFFDYVLAGITPIVINNSTTANWAEKNGFGYHAKDMDDFIRICKEEKPLAPFSNIEAIDMNKQIERLIKVYHVVSAQKEQHRPKKLSFNTLAEQFKTTKGNISFLTLGSNPKPAAALDMLMQYYKSGVWMYKENDTFYSHTSADSHAFYLSALCSIYKSGEHSVLPDILNLSSLLLALNNQNKGGIFGWGLGAPFENKIRSKEQGPSTCPETTTYTGISSSVCIALLEAYDITKNIQLLNSCQMWRESFFKHIGFNEINGCCLYGDHESWKLPEPLFIPNTTPSFIGFLSKLAQSSREIHDAKLIRQVGNSFWSLHKDYNWQYSNGQLEDLLHLGMIAEGMYMASPFLDPSIDISGLISQMISKMFKRRLDVNLERNCLGSSYWGPGWALYSFILNEAPIEYIAAGVDFLIKNPRIMLFNTRTSGIYARLLGKMKEKYLL